MSPAVVFALTLPILLFALVARRAGLEHLTPAIVMTGYGLLVGAGGLGLVDVAVSNAALDALAEVTLALILFSDAAGIDVARLRRRSRLPRRLLGLGLPLTMVAGFLVALLVLPGLALHEAALVAIVLAPTDAALGQAVMTNRAVPALIRQALNVESGLNDGIAFPALVVVASLAMADPGDALGVGSWAAFVGAQLALGPLVGLAVGWAGCRAAELAAARGWTGSENLRLAGAGLALCAFAGAELVSGNGFLAAFTAGAVVAARGGALIEGVGGFVETEGRLLNLVVFVLFGAILLPSVLGQIDVAHVLYAVLSLTVVRMIPVALGLLGTGLQAPSLAFLGWFGPRGLASIIYVLVLSEEYADLDTGGVATAVFTTVALSIVLHGVTAGWLASAYGRWSRGETIDQAD